MCLLTAYKGVLCSLSKSSMTFLHCLHVSSMLPPFTRFPLSLSPVGRIEMRPRMCYYDIVIGQYRLRHWLDACGISENELSRVGWALMNICLAFHKLRGPLLTGLDVENLNLILLSYHPKLAKLDQEFLLQCYFFVAGNHGHIHHSCTYSMVIEHVLQKFEEGHTARYEFDLPEDDTMLLPLPLIEEVPEGL